MAAIQIGMASVKPIAKRASASSGRKRARQMLASSETRPCRAWRQRCAGRAPCALRAASRDTSREQQYRQRERAAQRQQPDPARRERCEQRDAGTERHHAHRHCQERGGPGFDPAPASERQRAQHEREGARGERTAGAVQPRQARPAALRARAVEERAGSGHTGSAAQRRVPAHWITFLRALRAGGADAVSGGRQRRRLHGGWPWRCAGFRRGIAVVPTWLSNIVPRLDVSRLIAPEPSWFVQVGIHQYF